LTPLPVNPGSPEFDAISGWPFEDSFVARLFAEDIPRRTRFGNYRTWIYRDPDSRLAGFVTLDVSDDYRDYAGDQPYRYIPLLAINPTIPSCGYGATIVQHLTDEAALLAGREFCGDVLFLDVHLSSERAIALYTRLGFVQVNLEPVLDPEEGGKTYHVMVKRAGIAPDQWTAERAAPADCHTRSRYRTSG
jgi:ribosomal protein S18 acetylase RimI-like enzyme